MHARRKGAKRTSRSYVTPTVSRAPSWNGGIERDGAQLRSPQAPRCPLAPQKPRPVPAIRLPEPCRAARRSGDPLTAPF